MTKDTAIDTSMKILTQDNSLEEHKISSKRQTLQGTKANGRLKINNSAHK